MRGGEGGLGASVSIAGASARGESPQALLQSPSRDIIQTPLKFPLMALKSLSEDIVQSSSVKRKHTNWGKEEARDRMPTAVENWIGEKGLWYDDN